MLKPKAQIIHLTPEQAELLDLEIFEVIAAWHCSPDSHDLTALARSCYLQGLLDGSQPAVHQALARLQSAPSSEPFRVGNDPPQ